MPRSTRSILFVLALLALLPIVTKPLSAQTPVGTLEEEMAGLNRSVRQMVELLRVYLERQDAELILKRVELEIMQLAPLESELRDGRRQQTNLEDHVEHLEMSVRQVEDLLFERKDAMSEDEARGTRERLKNTQFELRLQKERSWRITQEVQDLESRILERRREVEALEAAADRLLAGDGSRQR